ncbi:MAG: DUF4364 family protein [Clostridium sp.]
MFKDTSELAENKLLLLYILEKLKVPTSNTLLTQIVLENNLINYFLLQQYLSELVDNGFIEDTKYNNTHKLTLTESGKSTLEFFTNRIPSEKITLIDEHLVEGKYLGEVFKSYLASFEEVDGVVKVSLYLKENDNITTSHTITVATQDEAIKICDMWRNKGDKVSESIRAILMDN